MTYTQSLHAMNVLVAVGRVGNLFCGRPTYTQSLLTINGLLAVHDIVLQDRRFTIRDIVEETGFSNHSMNNILEKELGMKN